MPPTPNPHTHQHPHPHPLSPCAPSLSPFSLLFDPPPPAPRAHNTRFTHTAGPAPGGTAPAPAPRAHNCPPGAAPGPRHRARIHPRRRRPAVHDRGGGRSPPRHAIAAPGARDRARARAWVPPWAARRPHPAPRQPLWHQPALPRRTAHPRGAAPALREGAGQGESPSPGGGRSYYVVDVITHIHCEL